MPLIFLTACGPSLEEKQNIAKITCNVMGESRNMDSSFRIKEINAARTELGEEPFLEGDNVIKESFKYRLCETLVAFPAEYSKQLEEMKQLEQAREEQERLNKIRKEQERVQRVSDSLKEWKSEILKRIETVPNPVLDVKFGVEYSDMFPLKLMINCSGLQHLRNTFTITFSNELGTLTALDPIGYCNNYTPVSSGVSDVTIDVDETDRENLYKVIGSKIEGSLMEFVKSVDVEIKGSAPNLVSTDTSRERSAYRYVDPMNFHTELLQSDLTDNPIKLRIYEK